MGNTITYLMSSLPSLYRDVVTGILCMVQWLITIVWCDIFINARHMRTSVTVVSLSVCPLPVYCLLLTFMQQNEHTCRFFAEYRRFPTNGFRYKAFFLKLRLQCCQVHRFFSIIRKNWLVYWYTDFFKHNIIQKNCGKCSLYMLK